MAIASFLAGHYSGEISSDWKSVLEWHGDGDILYNIQSSDSLFGRALMIGFLIVALGAILVSIVGMFLFWRFARTCYLAITIIFLVYLPFSGLSVYLPVQEFFGQIALLFEGAAIAMAYFSPIKDYFVGRDTPNMALDSDEQARRST